MADAKKSKNIEAAGPECLKWNSADVPGSLAQLLTYVEEEAQKSVAWYWRNKRAKAFFSRWIQFLAVILTSSAAILPIIGQLLGNGTLTNGLLASLLVGLAAALLALDKAFGLSSGWVRYVLAATNIRKLSEEFRIDWTSLVAKAGPNPTAADISALIQRAKEFRVAVETIVLQETKDWVTEFQNNLAQLEKDATAQLAALKAQIEKTAQSAQPGSIQLTVPNADKADNAKLQIKLESATETIADEPLAGSKTWVRLNVAPGQYRVTVAGTIAGKPASAMSAVMVRPAEITEVQIALAI